MEGNLFSNQHSGKGAIGFLTGLLGLYLSTAMWMEFNDALGTLIGSSIGIVIGTIIFLLYQTKKNEMEFTKGSSYTTSESTSIQRDSTGRMQQTESNTEKGRNPITFVIIMYSLVVILSEIAWADLIF
jgi:hypothetical protein